MRKQPSANFLVCLGGLNGGFELVTGYAFEGEERVVQWTIVMIFSQGSGHAGPALIDSSTGDGEAGNTIAGTVRGFMGQVAVDDGGIHNVIGFLARFWAKGWSVVPG